MNNQQLLVTLGVILIIAGHSGWGLFFILLAYL